MMRVCHLDTCPVGVATQNPVLRERFSGKAEYVVNFFEFIAEEVRELLAELGFRTLDEAIGHVENLDVGEAVDHWKASGLDLTPMLHKPDLPEDAALRNVTAQDHGLDKVARRHRAGAAGRRRRSSTASRCARRSRSATSTAPSARSSATRSPRGTAARACPAGTIDLTFLGSAGPVVRRVRAARA